MPNEKQTSSKNRVIVNCATCGKPKEIYLSTFKKNKSGLFFCNLACRYKTKKSLNHLFNDLTGLKFGNLTVVKRVENNKHSQAMWECQCNCGHINCLKTTIVSTDALNSDKTKSCGCNVKLKDLSGKSFNMLKVIKRVENRKGRAYWLCKCDCGTIKKIMGKSLLSGRTKSCGCYGKKQLKHNVKNLINLEFGRWKVIQRVESDKYGKAQWLCECSCEKKTRKIIPGSSLTCGHSKSCGCYKAEITGMRNFQDLTNKKFGRLTVIKRVGNGNKGQPRWLCKCDCGNETIVQGLSLRNGTTLSCGCYHKEKVSGKNNARWIGGKEYSGYESTTKVIGFAEQTRRDPENYNAVQVRCAYCNKWFSPSSSQVGQRKKGLMGKTSKEGWYTEGRFYCSSGCKEACPIYWREKWPKGFKKATSREVDPSLRQMCFERDDWTCQKCGSTENLHCHHIEGYTQNKMIANDLPNVITLCKKCHKEVHKLPGCHYHELRCDNNQKDKEVA